MADVSAEDNLLGAAMIPVGAVLAHGSYLDGQPLDDHGNGPVLGTGSDYLGKQGGYFVGKAVGGHVPVLDVPTQDRIPNGTANDVSLITGPVQSGAQFLYRAGDSEGNPSWQHDIQPPRAGFVRMIAETLFYQCTQVYWPLANCLCGPIGPATGSGQV